MPDDLDAQIEAAIAATAPKKRDRQTVDTFHMEPSDAEWLTSAGIAFDDRASIFKAIVAYRIYEANERNITVTAKVLGISFNSAKTHIRHYIRLSKDL